MHSHHDRRTTDGKACIGAVIYKLDGGRIVIFGGGIPLKSGDTIIGGLGISGGTGKEDHSLAEYGQAVLNELM